MKLRVLSNMRGRTMTMTISKDFRFEAAHSLPHLPVGHLWDKLKPALPGLSAVEVYETATTCVRYEGK